VTNYLLLFLSAYFELFFRSLPGAGPSAVPRHSLVPISPQGVKPEFTALPDNFVSARAIIQVAAANTGNLCSFFHTS
jgi:hypothetical protein